MIDWENFGLFSFFKIIGISLEVGLITQLIEKNWLFVGVILFLMFVFPAPEQLKA